MGERLETPAATWTGRVIGLCIAALAVMLTIKTGMVLFG